MLKYPSKRDLIASLVAFIIAIPLSLGIAVASGAPPAAGLISCIVGAIVVGALSGSRLVIAAPEASLSALVMQFIQQFGVAAVGEITFLAGALQGLFGLLRLGQYVKYIPRAVLYGLLSSIAVILITGQLHALMGQSLPSSVWASLTTIGDSLGKTFFTDQSIIEPVFLCGFLTVLAQMIWPMVSGRLCWVPAALPAVLIATLFSLPWEMPRVTIAPLLPTFQAEFHEFFAMGWFSKIGTYLMPAFGLALVASAQSLLSATAISAASPLEKPLEKIDLNRDLLANGLGNAISGAAGGIPITGAMVRSATLINAGAETRWANILHGIWVFLAIEIFTLVILQVPLAALAGVLIVTGARLLNIKLFVETLERRPADATLWLVTCGSILMTNLMIGMSIAAVYIVATRGVSNLVASIEKKPRRETASMS